MALDIDAPWFSYDNRGGFPDVAASVVDMTQDAGNSSPVKHVIDRFTFRQWQAPSHNEWFQLDFQKDVSLQCLAVVFPRITNPYRANETQEILPTDLIQHWLDADGGTAGTGAVFNSGAVACGAHADRGYSVLALDTAVSARYWRCQITANSRSSKGYFLVSYAQPGPIFQPSFPHIYGERIGFDDNSDLQRAASSQVGHVARNERTLKASLVWDFIPDSERASWASMDEFAGQTEPIVFALSSPNAATVSSVTGPNAKIVEGDRVFIGVNQSDLTLTSRQFDANIKQIQLTEHR